VTTEGQMNHSTSVSKVSTGIHGVHERSKLRLDEELEHHKVIEDSWSLKNFHKD